MAFGDEAASLEWPDIVAIAIYFAVLIAVALWASCTAKTDNAQSYFLAGRSMHWIPIGASTFSTNIGAPMFLGLAGSAAASGVSVTMFEWHAMWMLLLLGWIFLPVYVACGCYSMPQYLKMRFGGKRISIWLSVIYQFVTIISQIAGQMYAGAIFLQKIFHWELYPSIILILLVTAFFTIIGGLNVVIWTDTIQTAILIVGSFCVAGFALAEVGGFEAMRHQFLRAGANYTFRDVALYDNRTCGFPPDDSFHIFRAADSGDYPWPGMVFGLTILALNAWCTDQTCVQRSLSAKNMSHAKAGVTLAAYLKVLSFVFFIIPGMISRVLFPTEVGCADPVECELQCGNPAGCTDIAYPLLVLYILPTGIRGIMMAALLSALISSLTSIFNSSSTVFTMDLYTICRPKSKESERMIVGRLWIILLAILGTAWLPILQALQGSQFWSYTQSISSFLNPPIVMAFLFGIFWKRATEKGVFCGLVVGLITGVIRMGLDWSRVAPACGSNDPDDRFLVVSKVHYLHFAIILAGVSSIVIIVVSLFTEPRPEEKLRRVTWWTRHSPELQELSDDEFSDYEDDKKDTKSPSSAIKTNGEVHSNKSFSESPSTNRKLDNISHRSVKQEADNKSQASKNGAGVTLDDADRKSEKSVSYSQASSKSGSHKEKVGFGTKLKRFSLKWFCGIDQTVKRPHLTKEEIRAIQLKATNITEDPFWKKIVNINGIICAMCCFFLHGFWF